MKLRHILRALTAPPLPPVVQYARGLERDADFNPPELSFWERVTLVAWGSDGRRYELPPEDARRLRPILLRDPRAVRNEKLAADRASRRARGEPDRGPVSFANDAPQQAPGTAPAAYSLDAGFPDMPAEVKAFYSGSTKPQWGPRHQDRR